MKAPEGSPAPAESAPAEPFDVEKNREERRRKREEQLNEGLAATLSAFLETVGGGEAPPVAAQQYLTAIRRGDR